jgi:DNA polymerase
MQTDAEHLEFLALLKAAQEQVAYLRELGVEGTEKQSTDTSVKIGLTTERHQERYAVAAVQHQVAAPAAPSDTLFGDLSAPPLRIQKSSETFEEIWADIGDCTRCPLYQGRTNIVHTDGNRKARLMFVGEAPGADEDAQARPFVGRAGQLLTKIIEAIGLKREDVLIGNVNRCRPPANRPPTPEEASMCKPFLLREIAAVQPEVIVVLGNTAMKNLLDLKQGITRVRGQFQDYQGVKVMPTFHPAYLLRDPTKKKETWEDLKKVRDYLDTTRKQES